MAKYLVIGFAVLCLFGCGLVVQAALPAPSYCAEQKPMTGESVGFPPCQHFGVSEEHCYAGGCCWNATAKNDEFNPRCFYPLRCNENIVSTKRTDCKVHWNINRQICEENGCCWFGGKPKKDRCIPPVRFN